MTGKRLRTPTKIVVMITVGVGSAGGVENMHGGYTNKQNGKNRNTLKATEDTTDVHTYDKANNL